MEKYVEAGSSIRKAFSMDSSLDIKDKVKKYIKMSLISQRKDYYKILGVEKDSNIQIIRKAYK